MSDIHKTIEAVWKIESTLLIAGIARVTRDIGIAEELVAGCLNKSMKRLRVSLNFSNTGFPRHLTNHWTRSSMMTSSASSLPPASDPRS
jgi:hypothetical protein